MKEIKEEKNYVCAIVRDSMLTIELQDENLIKNKRTKEIKREKPKK